MRSSTDWVESGRSVALVSSAGRAVVRRHAAALELRRLHREDDADLQRRATALLDALGLTGLRYAARWADLTSHGTGTLGRLDPPRGLRPATAVLNAALLVRRGWQVGSVTVDPTLPLGFGRLVDDVLVHELAHSTVWWRTGSTGPEHGDAFVEAVEELVERGRGRLPSLVVPWLVSGWPMTCRRPAHYGDAARGLSAQWAAQLERTDLATISRLEDS